MSDTEWLTVEDVIASYPFSRGVFRLMLFKRDSNGLSIAVRKIGKKIYLRKDLLDKWIDDQVE